MRSPCSYSRNGRKEITGNIAVRLHSFTAAANGCARYFIPRHSIRQSAHSISPSDPARIYIVRSRTRISNRIKSRDTIDLVRQVSVPRPVFAHSTRRFRGPAPRNTRRILEKTNGRFRLILKLKRKNLNYDSNYEREPALSSCQRTCHADRSFD